MRRTRHVVLPVRSWQYTGFLIVSLACLTLGLVSRDREGQAGSLAGPDLQHGAPHKVDACPNEIVFNRLLFYDDFEPDFGPILTDQTKKHTASSENVLNVKKLEAMENGKVRVISSSSAAMLRRTTERASRFSDVRKNVRFVRDHRGSLNRNSRAIEDHRKENRLAEGNRHDEYQRSRSARSTNRDYGMRVLPLENQRRFTKISDQRSRTHRTIVERLSLEGQKNRQPRHVRSSEAKETVAQLLVKNRAERSKTREIRNDQSDRRDSKTRNARVAVDLSATRRMIAKATETDSSTEDSSSTNERRIRRFTRSVRVHQSRVRNSAVERSREDFRSSERESTNENRSERRNRQIGIRSELRNARLNPQIRGSRSIVGDSTSRDSRLAVDPKDERLTRRASSFFRSDSVIDKSRLTNKRTRISLNRPIENSRSLKRDAKQEASQLTPQRRGDRRSRDIRDERSSQGSIRYSRVLREGESFDRRTDRRSLSRSDSRHRRSIDNRFFERRDSISDREIDQQRAIRDSRDRERRNTREIRGTGSSEFNARSRNSRSLVIRSNERMGRDIRAIQRDSRVRDVQPALHYRDARYSDGEFSQSVKYFMRAAVIRRLNNSLPRHRLWSVNHREQRFEKQNRATASHRNMNERGSTRIMDGGDLMRRDELLPYRQARARGEKNNETNRRDFERNRQIRESKTLKNPHVNEVTWADVTNSLTEGIALTTKFEVLQQLSIQLLCVVYCASLYSGKGGFSSIFFNRGNRFLIW